MATYAVSDMHGCKAALDALLDHVGLGEKDELWVLGDLADRGPDPVGVLAWATIAPENVHFLLGNHDQMMLSCLSRDPEHPAPGVNDDWLFNGGVQTCDELRERTTARWRTESLVPFLEALEPTARVEAGGTEFQLVHAGFDPAYYDDGEADEPDEASYADLRYVPGFGLQSVNDMIWIRQPWLLDAAPSPVACVFGHTPTINWPVLEPRFAARGIAATGASGEPIVALNRIDIDCGCAYGGALCLLCLDDLTYSLADVAGALTRIDVPLELPSSA